MTTEQVAEAGHVSRTAWFRPAVAGAFVVGACLRLGVLAVKWSDPLTLSDSLWYSASGVVIARGDGFADPFYGGPTAEHGPLTPLVLSIVSWIDDPVPWQRAVNTVVGMATIVVIARLASLVAGGAAAIAAAWIAALYPNLWMHDSAVMSESLACLTTATALLAAVMAIERRSWRAAAVAGVAAGLAALARSELALLVVLLAVVVWWRLRVALQADDVDRRAASRAASRAAGTLVVGAALVLVPWIGANLVRFERPVLLTTNDGTTLLGANCDDTYGRGGDLGGWSLFCVLADGSPEGEDPSVRAARQRSKALEYVGDHVSSLPKVLAARAGRGLDLYGVGNLVHADVAEGQHRAVSWAGIVAWWLLAPLAALGAHRLWRREPGVLAVLMVPVFTVAFTTLAFYGAHRVRAPLEPAVVVLAAAWLGPRMAGAARIAR